MLRQLIEQLSKDFGNEPLAPNDDGSYSLRLEPDLDINLRETSEMTILMQVGLANLPEKKLSECLLYLMTANLFGRETGGSSLGLDRDGKKTKLINFIPAASTYREFHDFLEDFVNYAESWRQEILDFEKKTETD